MGILLISSSSESFLELIGVLLIFIAILVITYVCTRWISGYQKQQMKNGNLSVIETIPAGANKMICLVKAGTEYLVVGVGKDEMHLLTKLSEEQLTDFRFQQENIISVNESFQDILGKIKGKLPKK